MDALSSSRPWLDILSNEVFPRGLLPRLGELVVHGGAKQMLWGFVSMGVSTMLPYYPISIIESVPMIGFWGHINKVLYNNPHDLTINLRSCIKTAVNPYLVTEDRVFSQALLQNPILEPFGQRSGESGFFLSIVLQPDPIHGVKVALIILDNGWRFEAGSLIMGVPHLKHSLGSFHI
uniref:Uncharacterized protein n=1 Tax=Cannabis sativa TaxID=3483 RepID=A0A803QRH8_CANSA